MTNEFLEDRSAYLVDLDDIAIQDREAYQNRYIELLEDPDQRDEEIAEFFVEYLYNQMIVETGDESLTDAYILALDDMIDLSWEELHSIPQPERGNLWSTGRALVSAIAERQAFVELIAPEALGIGQDMGELNRKAAARMTDKQKADASKSGVSTKERMAKRKAVPKEEEGTE